MSPIPADSINRDKGFLRILDESTGYDGSRHDLWLTVTAWISNFFSGINNETLEHPYFISFALVVLWAWPHILMLPIWFGRDAVRRMDNHARTAAKRAAAPVRQRKRDVFVTRYRAIVTATYEQPSGSTQTQLFGGTPLSNGDFRIEEEQHLPVVLRVIRWSALIWAIYIIGRELYYFILHQS